MTVASEGRPSHGSACSASPPGQAPIVYRRLRAPQASGEALLDPPLHQAPALVRHNMELLSAGSCDFAGRSLAALQKFARAELVSLATEYTRSYRDLDSAPDSSSSIRAEDRPLILSGHQPQLFHPGVWFKNFVLASVARRAGATAVNLIIDNDLIREAAIRAPTLSAAGFQATSIALDDAIAPIPFEERTVSSEATFASFAERVRTHMTPLVAAPLAGELWRQLPRRGGEEPNLGRRLAQARNRLEANWGVASLEAPLGEVCQTPSFLWFACRLLAHARCFAETHNAVLAEYRQVHGIRSRLHPVPDLTGVEESAEWTETPFWIWTAADPRRRKVFVRTGAEGVEITDREQVRIALPLSAESAAERSVDRLLELARQGVKLRPRALVTTMYARLCLSDLFLHGIGGAKYDQVTDAIIARFFQLGAPRFLTVTATFRLPGEESLPSDDDLAQIDHRLRAIEYHPETLLAVGSNSPRLAEAIEKKSRWIERTSVAPPQSLPRNERIERHRDIAQANAVLVEALQPVRQELLAQRERLIKSLPAARLLRSREFSFCLFPAEALRQPLMELSR